MEAVEVVQQLNNQGLMNPTVVFPKLVGLCFELGDIPRRAVPLALAMGKNHSILTSRLEECVRFGFVNLLRCGSLTCGQEKMDPAHFIAMSELY